MAAQKLKVLKMQTGLSVTYPEQLVGEPQTPMELFRSLEALTDHDEYN